MKKSSKLAESILNNEIASITEGLGHRLNAVIDSMTDENCNPLPSADKNLVTELKAIAFKLYELNECTIPAGPVESTANVFEFVKDHVEHFDAMPMEYEDENGKVHDFDEIIEMLSEEELAELEDKLQKSQSGAEKLDHDSVT